ncbi:hypothetical protein [Paraburkholderia terrae]|uniref:hypothetical protein n=1 Tax=Paraburkholderia terrae TaxID=311230 RepID=UPI001EE2B23A|nr:hypothetical protein [Paraburkholderia terrae]GJH02728.1 hypothetical protein CBA19C8_19245 [Paraburkholderia terrae]
MNQQQYLNDIEVNAFVDWLAGFADRLLVDLNINRSARVPTAVVRNVQGFDNLIDSYIWRANWEDDDGTQVDSLCWDSTAQSLARLGKRMRAALESQSAEAVMTACAATFRWGGERNAGRGARPFLKEKHANGQLVDYLVAAREAFSLKRGRLDQLHAIELVNSMLTKIYALASGDGLPIYDSRVAAAIASLVEIYRIETHRDWQQVPGKLLFPTMAAESRRMLVGLHPNALISAGAVIRYQDPNMSARWASAKLRLGWIVEDVLRRAPKLLSSQPHSRHHAFEASLFMIGYDVRCLAPNL